LIWRVEWDDRARRELRRLGPDTQRAILRYLRERVAGRQNPRRFGMLLRGAFAGLWRDRVGKYRLVCRIEDDRLIVLVLKVGHRREIYER
jgi:mRNA interferase RelE/StbE